LRERESRPVERGSVYSTKSKGPRTEPWEHHRRRYVRKRDYDHI